MAEKTFAIQPIEHYLKNVVERIYGDRATETFKKKQVERVISAIENLGIIDTTDGINRLEKLAGDLAEICIGEIEDGLDEYNAGDYTVINGDEYWIEVKIVRMEEDDED